MRAVPRRPRHFKIVASAVLIGMLLCSHSALATERIFRLLDQRDGLPVGEVVQLAQDRDGFIWIGTFAGLVRYDGNELRQWAPEQLGGHVSTLTAGPGGDVLIRIDSGSQAQIEQTGLYRVVPHGVEAVTGPDGRPVLHVLDAAFSSSGLLCIARGDHALCRLPSGDWTRHVFGDAALEQAQRVRAGADGTLLVITDAGVWQIAGDGGKRKVIALPSVINVVAHPNGSLFALTVESRTGRLVRIDAAGATTLVSLDARPIGLAVRGDVVWASFYQSLVVVRPHESPEILRTGNDLPSGGPLLVDREGSLWYGTYRGLVHLPEPETIIWTEEDGLPSVHTRFVRRVGDTMWIGSWQGLGRLTRQDSRWRADPESHPGRDRMCVDGQGRLWLANLGVGFVRHTLERRVVYPDRRIENWLGCALRPDGSLWITNGLGIFSTAAEGAPRRVASNPPDPDEAIFFRQIYEDAQRILWVAANEQICQAQASAVRTGTQVQWMCEHIPDARGISAIAEQADGHVWIATDRAGVWRQESGRWLQLPGSRSLPSYSIRGLVPSRAGGVWILGHGTVVRVVEDHDSPQGWSIIERLGGLHGLPSAAAEDLLEEPDGSLWITTTVGLVQVPARARYAKLRPPGVQLVDVIVNGQRVTPEVSALQLKTVDVLELRFAALAYRDRARLRHQYRLQPDGRWTLSQGGPSVFQFPDLGPGRYTVQVRASLDGHQWSPYMSSLAFEILPPWYQRNWALAIFAFAALSLLYVAYRLRLAFLLRLERQRTRIAMDLHDEIGSGLGSIHILAGLAADRTSPESPQAGLVQTIGDTAAELAASLGEIVWSLRSRSTSLEALVSHVAERAARLYATGPPSLMLAIPESLPPIDLPLSVRWNVALIAIEALHNAARHSGATSVVLGLEPHGRLWNLYVEDDGRGLEAAAEPRGPGVGVQSMKRRAAEIGATLAMSTNESGGLTVSLTFDPLAARSEV